MSDKDTVFISLTFMEFDVYLFRFLTQLGFKFINSAVSKFDIRHKNTNAT